jgi:hypothetical protein
MELGYRSAGATRSPYRRLRVLSTLGLALATLLALTLLAFGHHLHAALTGLAALSLLPTSHLGRRARRQAAIGAVWAQQARSPAKSRRAA